MVHDGRLHKTIWIHFHLPIKQGLYFFESNTYSNACLDPLCKKLFDIGYEIEEKLKQKESNYGY